LPVASAWRLTREHARHVRNARGWAAREPVADFAMTAAGMTAMTVIFLPRDDSVVGGGKHDCPCMLGEHAFWPSNRG
jgi:hypothetical protein